MQYCTETFTIYMDWVTGQLFQRQKGLDAIDSGRRLALRPYYKIVKVCNDGDDEDFDRAGQTLWDMPHHPCAAGQLPEAPSALWLVPHPASPLGVALLAGAYLQVGFCPICQNCQIALTRPSL